MFSVCSLFSIHMIKKLNFDATRYFYCLTCLNDEHFVNISM